MIRQVKCIATTGIDKHGLSFQPPYIGSIYTVVREGERFLFLEEIEDGLVGKPKEWFVDVDVPKEPNTQAVKYDSGKARLELLSTPALFAISRVMTKGAVKYAPHNWRNGFEWSRLIGAALRHIFLWMNGEDKDPETGESHLAHAGCCIMFLLEHEERKLGTDDRYKAS